MADYTPTNDVFKTFIHSLERSQDAKRQRKQDEANAIKEQLAQDLTKAKFDIDMRRGSGNYITGLEDYQKGMERVGQYEANQTSRSLDQVLADPNGGAPYTKPFASPEMVQQALGDKAGEMTPELNRYQKGFENLSTAIQPSYIDPNSGGTYTPISPSFGKQSLNVTKPNMVSGSGGMGGAGGAPLTEAGLDTAAKVYIQTGQVPNVGMGAAANRVQIINRAGEMLKNKKTGKVDIAPMIVNTAKNKANQSSYAQLQKQADNIGAFETTATMNADVAMSMANKVNRTGVPVLNRWLNAGRRSITGDADLIGFDTAVRTFVNEYARITTSVTGGGVTSDTARKEVEDLLKAAHTPEQFMSSLNVAKQDMRNRVQSYIDQFGVIDARMEKQVNPPTLKDPNVRLNELVKSGKTEQEAYKTMAQEGYK